MTKLLPKQEDKKEYAQKIVEYGESYLDIFPLGGLTSDDFEENN